MGLGYAVNPTQYFRTDWVENYNMHLQPLYPEWSEETATLEDGCKLVEL